MTKTVALSLVLAASLGLAACAKKEEGNAMNAANVAAENAVNAAENTMDAAMNVADNVANAAGNTANAM